MPELDADFEISTNNLEAEYEITQSEHFDCSFEIFAAGTTFSSIMGSPYDNAALSDALNQKADNSTVETLSETVENNYTELDGKITDESDARTQADADLQSNIDDIADDLSIETDNRQTADADLQDNIDTVDGKIDTHIADKTNPHEVTKAQIGLGNVDNTSDLNKPISTATQTALNGKQNTINDLSEIRTNASNGQSAYNTIQNYGDIVTYDASYFATKNQGEKADTALQPNDNITELNNNAGYITSASLPTVNNNKITIQKNSTDAGSFTLNQSSDKTINISVPTQASDINAVPTSRKINNKPLSSDITLTASDVNALSSSTTINDLTTSAQQDALNSGATSTNIGQIATNTQNITNEVTNRQNADNNLQSQIDAIVASSDVFDIVGTYADLQAYDISTVPVNDIIKVLVDSTHSNAATYYRCVETGGVKSWSYIGSEGAYYTKSESDSLFVEQTTTVNNKPLSTNITLTASDVGALPSSTTIGNGVLTIQNNSVDVDTFSANATSNKTINIVTPTKTSDLTNNSGFIDNTDLTNGLATKQDTLIAGTDLEIIPAQAPILPEGFTQIEYIEGTGTQYIDTGFYGTQNSGVYIKYALTDLTSNGSARVFGTRNGTLGTGAFAFISSKDGTSLPNDNFYIASNGSASQSTNIDANWHEVSCNIENDKKVYFDGNLIFTGSNTAYTSTAQASIFRTYNRTAYGAVATAKIGIVQIYENAVMVHNFIPCRRDSDDELGMYDLVSDTFFTNSGTGTFIAGPDVIFPETDLINFTNESGYIKGIDSTDVITALGYTPYDSTNPNGFTSNVGTVTSVNNTQPDANGNVTISVTGGANIDLSNLSATGEAHFLKSINSTDVINALGYTPENQANKVTSFSSSSTDTQYPSAKLLYDQLLLKQNTSTAVTHTANWAVGNSTTPVYINSSGVAISTTLSIASSRFDGQWVLSYHGSLVTASSAGSSQASISTYLPSDSYDYEVMFYLAANYDSSAGDVAIGNAASPLSNNCIRIKGRVRNTSASVHCTGIIPIKSSARIIYTQREVKVSAFQVDMIAYRRIGTNT